MITTLMIGLSLTTTQMDVATGREIEIHKIGTSDLDLTTRTGKAQLGRRIRVACGDPPNVDIVGRVAMHDCRADASAQAKAIEEALYYRRQGVKLASR